MNLLRILIAVGAITIGIISLILTDSDTKMWAGMTFAFLLLVAAAAPKVFRSISISVADKFCNMRGIENESKSKDKA